MLPKLRTLAARKYLKVDCSMVTPIANAYWKNSKFMSPIAGGVAINANMLSVTSMPLSIPAVN